MIEVNAHDNVNDRIFVAYESIDKNGNLKIFTEVALILKYDKDNDEIVLDKPLLSHNLSRVFKPEELFPAEISAILALRDRSKVRCENLKEMIESHECTIDAANKAIREINRDTKEAGL